MRSSIPAAAPALLSRRQWLGLPLLVLPGVASAGYNFWTGDYTLSHHELQTQVEKKFPLKLRYSELFEVQLTDPDLRLDAGTNRATLAAQVQIRNPIVQPRQVQGQLAISSGLKFDAASNAIRLDQPTAERVALEGLSRQGAQQLQTVGAVVAQELLRDYALYTFKPEELRRFGKTFEPGAITVMADGIKVSGR
jgi:hypothetical protein